MFFRSVTFRVNCVDLHTSPPLIAIRGLSSSKDPLTYKSTQRASNTHAVVILNLRVQVFCLSFCSHVEHILIRSLHIFGRKIVSMYHIIKLTLGKNEINKNVRTGCMHKQHNRAHTGVLIRMKCSTANAA